MPFFPRLISYFAGWHIRSWESATSGTVSLWLVNGKKVLNTPHANYSYDSLHKAFRKYLHTLSHIDPHPESILLLGLGGGSAIGIIREELNINAPITAVDIDPLMHEISREVFRIGRFSNLQLIEADALSFIQKTTRHFDWILTDIFIDQNIPETFCNRAFIDAATEKLNPGGKFLMNFIVSHQEGKNQSEKVKTILEEKRMPITLVPVGKENLGVIARL